MGKFVDFVYFFVPRLVILCMAFLYDLEKERNPDDPKSPPKGKTPSTNPRKKTLLRKVTGGISPSTTRKAAVQVGHSFGFLSIVGAFLKFINFMDPLFSFLAFGPLMPFFAGFFACLAVIRDTSLFIRPCTDVML